MGGAIPLQGWAARRRRSQGDMRWTTPNIPGSSALARAPFFDADQAVREFQQYRGWQRDSLITLFDCRWDN